MTRINTIDVALLTDQHLMAEYRELPMVHASLRRTKESKRVLAKGFKAVVIPSSYTLNRGHVTFFYDKGLWLYDRYQSLVDELRKRGYNVNPSERKVDWSVFDGHNLYNDWKPDECAHHVNLERIMYRINEKRDWYRYRGKPVTDMYFNTISETYNYE